MLQYLNVCEISCFDMCLACKNTFAFTTSCSIKIIIKCFVPQSKARWKVKIWLVALMEMLEIWFVDFYAKHKSAHASLHRAFVSFTIIMSFHRFSQRKRSTSQYLSARKLHYCTVKSELKLHQKKRRFEVDFSLSRSFSDLISVLIAWLNKQ